MFVILKDIFLEAMPGRDKFYKIINENGLMLKPERRRHTTNSNRKRIRDAAFFLIIMLVTFAATLLKPQNYVSSRTIQKCVEHVSTST